jgi:hypothetical protein
MVVTDDLGGQGTRRFVAANSASGAAMVQAVAGKYSWSTFRRRRSLGDGARRSGASRAEYAGQYRPARRSYTQFEQVLNIGTINVTATRKGSRRRDRRSAARVRGDRQSLFRQTNGDRSHSCDERGAINHLVATSERSARRFFASPQWLALVVLATLLTCIGVLIAAVRRRSADALTAIAIAWLTFVVLVVWVLPFAAPQAQDQFVYGYPQPMLKLALAVGVVATGLSVLGIATLVPVWRERTWPIGRQLRHTAAVALFVVLVATLLQWNAIGFRYF